MLNNLDRETVEKAYEDNLNAILVDLSKTADLMYVFTPSFLSKFRANIMRILKAFETCVPNFEDAEGNTEKLYESLQLRVAMPSDTLVDITISGNVIADVPYKYKFRIQRKENSTSGSIFDNVVDNIYPIYQSFLVDALVRMNLRKVNVVMEDICKKAGLGYTVKFASRFNTDKVVQKITDEEIVYTISEDKQFDMDNVIILMDDPIKMDKIERARNTMAEEFASVPTTVKFLDAKFPIIKLLAGVSGRVKAMTYIRKVTGRNALATVKNSRCTAYYDVGNTFALVDFTDDGLEVVLTPFNTKTFDYVDKDVKAEIENSERYNA